MSDMHLMTTTAGHDPALTDRVIHLLGQHTGKDCAAWTAATTLEDVGVDSFDFIEFVFLLEDEFGIEIAYNHNDSTTRFATIGDVANAVESVAGPKTPPASLADVARAAASAGAPSQIDQAKALA